MSELDLSKAIEAIGEAIKQQRFAREVPVFNGRLRLRIANDANEILTAALPHILDALAEQYDAEARRYGDGLNFPPANDWLRAKADELRNT